MPAMTASASRSIGTTFGDTKEVTSMRGMPVAERRSTTSILSSVGMNSGSIWNPSRVPTSQIVTCLGSFKASSPVGCLPFLSQDLNTRCRISIRARHAEHVFPDVCHHQVVVDGRGLVEARLAELALDVVLLGEAVAAVGVDAGIGRVPCRLRRQVLGHVGLGTAGQAGVEELGGLGAHEVAGLDGHVRLGDRELPPLVGADGLAEDHALARIGYRLLDEPA